LDFTGEAEITEYVTEKQNIRTSNLFSTILDLFAIDGTDFPKNISLLNSNK